MRRLGSLLFVVSWPLYLFGYALTTGCMVAALDWSMLRAEFMSHLNRVRGRA